LADRDRGIDPVVWLVLLCAGILLATAQMNHYPIVTGRVLGYRAVQVLTYVHGELERCGIAPSYTMICDELGISSRAKVCAVIKSLEKRGLLSRTGNARVRTAAGHRVRCLALGNTTQRGFAA
jgi:hypothetical protein